MNRRYSMMSIAAVVAVAGLLFASTYSQTQMTASSQSVPSAPAQASIKAVDDMGGIKLQMPNAFAQIPVDQIANLTAQGRHVVDVKLVAQSTTLPIMGGGKYYALTFNGQVPGPTVRVTQGDIVRVTLTVPSTESTPHSIDMHAAQLSATNFGAVKIGQSNTYAFIAETPGAFKYHCEGVNLASMDQHVLSGMYGVLIVDPLNGYNPLIVDKTATQGGKVIVVHHRYEAAAKEFVLQYNQLYLNADGSYDQTAMFLHNTTQTVVNGMAFGYTPNADINKLIKGDPTKNVFPVQPWNDPSLKQYQGHPLFVDLDTHYRLFVVNQGNMPVFFHIVGGQLARVVQGNHVQAQGVQTWLIGGSQDAIIDAVFDSPGAYVAVNHDYAAIFTGAATVFVAGDPFNLGYHPGDMPNPSDAVPPVGVDSIPQKEIVHCLCTDDQAAAIAKSLSG
ncbi:multicopper oxidase domain-containing protein [Candidatus Nitrosotalea okcheonensis]|uniref:Copper-containing nitrite reductase n=1 Tax=Candidatus Nitrosotalea okcheonensis TaxID=1903276 RepID=A0A2H1FFH6_9ARCH|nr:multicopper oxidase domain-containing protein [Candidatus Nitrosotalea okcheonensis]SMH71529.1 NirK, nitrite reductase multicopper oxidase [Candidatus Nitrosotalea okcheonensis]